MNTLTPEELLLEDRLITNAIEMVQRLKAAGDYARARVLEEILKVRRNQWLLASAAFFV